VKRTKKPSKSSFYRSNYPALLQRPAAELDIMRWLSRKQVHSGTSVSKWVVRQNGRRTLSILYSGSVWTISIPETECVYVWVRRCASRVTTLLFFL